jgi:glycosyltransferase involved in cell wall biosynthesis
MKVFIAGTSFAATYGGPAVSVARLAVALTDVGVEVGVWAPDGSAITSPFLAPDATAVRLAGTERDALNRFAGVDVLHDNGIWLPHNHRLAALALRRGIPKIVSVRGMLEPWALHHRRLKKSLAWWLYQRRDLKRAQSLHATSEAEAANIRGHDLGVPVCVIPNGVDLPELHGAPRTKGDRRSDGLGGPRVALFLGRIHPVKGLPMLINAWARVRPAGWVLKIAGPDEAGHRAAVEDVVANSGLRGCVEFVGPLEAEAKSFAFEQAELFILPTHSESFGMVIAEALAHGLPVLTTTRAPWPLLRRRNCGWWVEPDVEAIAAALRLATSLDSSVLRQMGARGRALAIEGFGWTHIARQFVAVYEKLASSHRRGPSSTMARPAE